MVLDHPLRGKAEVNLTTGKRIMPQGNHTVLNVALNEVPIEVMMRRAQMNAELEKQHDDQHHEEHHTHDANTTEKRTEKRRSVGNPMRRASFGDLADASIKIPILQGLPFTVTGKAKQTIHFEWWPLQACIEKNITGAHDDFCTERVFRQEKEWDNVAVEEIEIMDDEMRNLEAIFDRFGMDASRYGHNGAKSLKDLLKECRDGR